MPRPNRYHPYARGNQSALPRYPTPSSLSRRSPTMPIIAEQPLARPFQCIYPGYIRASTSDGKALVAKSVFQAPDGILHVQMQVVRFPSEDIKLYNHAAPLPFTPCYGVPQQQEQIDPSLSAIGLNTGQMITKDGGSESSQDGHSVRSASEECAIVSDDEDIDAEGETEDALDDAQWRAIMEQRQIMAGLVAQREAWGVSQ